MKKTLFFLSQFLFFINVVAQDKIPRAHAVQAKTSKPVTVQNTTINEGNRLVKGTVYFNENGGANKIASSKTNGVFSIYMFESVSEADVFANNFKNSDPNIMDFYFTGIKEELYYFSITLKEPRDTKWYLNLFKNNNLTYISYNKKFKTIDQALSK